MKVVDNTNGYAEYVVEGELSPVVEGKSSRDLNIGSGWTGDGYGEVRASDHLQYWDDIYLSMGEGWLKVGLVGG